MIANRMEGSMPIMLRVVAKPILPMRMPFNIVLTMEADEACWAILSEEAEMM